ncbi:MAG: hypothetical protein OEU49_07665 [Chromatiales bacterium]|nr:hypothetical protein [Rhodospirillales bacterium]MDH4030709.1 hypothetical protein [Chromatiales bacterium]
MTDDRMALQTLLEKASDADLLREMIGFAAERLMALEDDNEDREHDSREPQCDRETSYAEDDFSAPLNAWAHRS